ncbi:MAG: c-type cytochrome [Mariprofundaceae bacterium]
MSIDFMLVVHRIERMKLRYVLLIFTMFISLMSCSAETPQEEPSTRDKQSHNSVNTIMNAMERDAMPGAKLVRRKCKSCHDLERNLKRMGPTLRGIFNRKPSIKDVPFSKWDENALDAWIKNPVSIKPKTRMAIPGISSPDDRAAIIAYLRML